MNIIEKAKKYADGKAQDVITTALEEAYTNGYKDGWADSELSAKNIVCDGVEYIDLDLPSGTKWSIDYIRDKNNVAVHFSYDEAAKLNLPTKEQYQELLDYTERFSRNTKITNGIDFLGRNGNTLSLAHATFYVASHLNSVGTFLFWLKDEECDGDSRLCAYNSITEKRYMGYKLRVLLVK